MCREVKDLDPNPPQGRGTNYCWVAAVVCAAHDLGHSVGSFRSAEGVAWDIRDYKTGQHMGVVLAWCDEEVVISDSLGDDDRLSARTHRFPPPDHRWFRPLVAILRPPS